MTQEMDLQTRNPFPNQPLPARQEGGTPPQDPQDPPPRNSQNRDRQSSISSQGSRGSQGSQQQHPTPRRSQYRTSHISLENAPSKFKQLRASQCLTRAETEANKHKMKAHLRIATLNLNGRGADKISHQDHKWIKIHELMFSGRDKIAIFAIQETHLSQKHVDNIHDSIYGRKMKIFIAVFEIIGEPAFTALFFQISRPILRDR